MLTLMHQVITRFLVLSLLVGVVVGWASPVAAQPTIGPAPATRPILPGLPDLVAYVSTTPDRILGGANSGMYEDAAVTIRVENRLTERPSPFPGRPGASEVYGSNATNVEVAIILAGPLRQVGNVTAEGGFQCSISSDNQSIFCRQGTLPAGASVNIRTSVIAREPTCTNESILVRVDPDNRISEVSETDNQVSTSIFIVCLR